MSNGVLPPGFDAQNPDTWPDDAKNVFSEAVGTLLGVSLVSQLALDNALFNPAAEIINEAMSD
ncbi:MAG: hypothetical protein ACRCWO_08555 [Bosea sp. (in: a-proteobacteria)]